VIDCAHFVGRQPNLIIVRHVHDVRRQAFASVCALCRSCDLALIGRAQDDARALRERSLHDSKDDAGRSADDDDILVCKRSYDEYRGEYPIDSRTTYSGASSEK
jgi:hypothetical protein